MQIEEVEVDGAIIDFETQVLLDEKCEIPETDEIIEIPEVEIQIPEEESACVDSNNNNEYPDGFHAENIIF